MMVDYGQVKEDYAKKDAEIAGLKAEIEGLKVLEVKPKKGEWWLVTLGDGCRYYCLEFDCEDRCFDSDRCYWVSKGQCVPIRKMFTGTQYELGNSRAATTSSETDT